ncbi:hypothetical protein F5Y03DRAFT_352139 [Xylaria venustula]|nr:hypothetical protein F5Y03DRAFT_352139 [Xylaria venustula]
MKFSLTATFSAASLLAHAASTSTIRTMNSTTITVSIPVISTTVTTTSSSFSTSTPAPTSTSTSTPTPTPTRYIMQCGGGMDSLCNDVCFCASPNMNCHADPSGRCYQMCSCVAESV